MLDELPDVLPAPTSPEVVAPAHVEVTIMVQVLVSRVWIRGIPVQWVKASTGIAVV